MISVLVAYHQRMFCQGLQRLFSEDGRFQVVGGGRNGSEALERIRSDQPDVAIVAMSLPKPDGVEVVTTVIRENLATKCVILLGCADSGEARRAMDCGARGCLLKEAPFEELAEMVVRTAGGEAGLCHLRFAPERQRETAKLRLSCREEGVLRLVGRGFTSKQIGLALFISARTVDCHRLRIMQKLGIGNGPGLVKFAIENGII